MASESAARKAISRLNEKQGSHADSQKTEEKEKEEKHGQERKPWFMDGCIVSENSLKWPGSEWNGKVYGKDDTARVYLNNTPVKIAGETEKVFRSISSDKTAAKIFEGGKWNGRIYGEEGKWKVYVSRNARKISDDDKRSLINTLRRGASDLGKSTRLDTDEIHHAKHIDLYDFVLQTEPEDWQKVGSGLRNRVYDSMHIKAPGSNYCKRFSTDETFDPVQYLMDFKDYSFKDAVLYLNEGEYAPAKEYAEEEKNISIPKESRHKDGTPDNKCAINYLKSRGISEQTINKLIDRGYIYQEEKNRNIVFISKDRRSYEARGTGQGKYHRNQCRTSKDMFRFQTGEKTTPDKIYFCEGAIDAVSLYDMLLQKNGQEENAIFCSMMGVGNQQRIDYAKDLSFVKSGETQIVIATDNDEHGLQRMNKNPDCARLVPKGKDFNEDLQNGLSLNEIISGESNESRQESQENEISGYEKLEASLITEHAEEIRESIESSDIDDGFEDVDPKEVPFDVPFDVDVPFEKDEQDKEGLSKTAEPDPVQNIINEKEFQDAISSISTGIDAIRTSQRKGMAAILNETEISNKARVTDIVNACGVEDILTKAYDTLAGYERSENLNRTLSYKEMKSHPGTAAVLSQVTEILDEAWKSGLVQDECMRNFTSMYETIEKTDSMPLKRFSAQTESILTFKNFIERTYTGAIEKQPDEKCEPEETNTFEKEPDAHEYEEEI